MDCRLFLVIPFVISCKERTFENRSWFISTIREKTISIGMFLGGVTFFLSGFFSKLSIFRVWNIEGDTVFDTYSGIVWARSTETINNVFGYIFLGLLVVVMLLNLILLLKERKKEK